MIEIVQVPVKDLKPALYNPRKWSVDQVTQLKESITRFGMVDPLIVNSSGDRRNIVIGGHFRLFCAQELGYTEVPVVYVDIPDEAREKEFNLRLNKNKGDFDFKLLAENFDTDLLKDVGFTGLQIGKTLESFGKTKVEFEDNAPECGHCKIHCPEPL